MSIAGGRGSLDAALWEEKLHPITTCFLEETRQEVNAEKSEPSEQQQDEQKQREVLHQKQLDWIIDRSEEVNKFFPGLFKSLEQNKKLSASENIKNFINILNRVYSESFYQAALFLKPKSNKAPVQDNSYKKRCIASILLAIAHYKVGDLDGRIYKDLLTKYRNVKPFLNILHTMPVMNLGLMLDVDPAKLKNSK